MENFFSKQAILFLLVFYSVSTCDGIQFEFLSQGAKNIAVGRTGANLFKDPTLTIVNPANISLENSYISLYYEATSSVNVGSIIELYRKRFVFDPANIGISIRIDDLTRLSILYTTYIYDIDTPETFYKPFLFGLSRKVNSFLLLGGAVGPVFGISENIPTFSFMAVGGLKVKLDDFRASIVLKSPFSTSYQNSYYGLVQQTFPPVVSTGISFSIFNNLIVSTSLDLVFLNLMSARTDNYEIFTPRDSLLDYLLPKIGFIYYDDISGYRIMLGFSKTQLEIISRSYSQFHLTAGVTFFIRIPNFNDFEVNFCVDDQILLNVLRIFPENTRKISIYVSGELRF